MQTVDFDRLLDGGERVLDVGCGDGRHTHGAALHDADVTVVACDIDPDRLQNARDGLASLDDPAWADGDDGDGRGVDGGDGNDERDDDDGDGVGEADGRLTDAAAFVRADAYGLPFPDDAFDVVVCAEVLEHLPAYERAVEELARVLKPGGRLGVSVPRYGPERVCWALSDAYHAVEGGHVRIFRGEELRATLEASGLRLVDTGFAHALHSPYWWLKCLWWDRDEADRPPVPLAAYERFLEWVVVTETPRVDALERALDPVLGKSRVLYCVNEDAPSTGALAP